MARASHSPALARRTARPRLRRRRFSPTGRRLRPRRRTSPSSLERRSAGEMKQYTADRESNKLEFSRRRRAWLAQCSLSCKRLFSAVGFNRERNIVRYSRFVMAAGAAEPCAASSTPASSARSPAAPGRSAPQIEAGESFECLGAACAAVRLSISRQSWRGVPRRLRGTSGTSCRGRRLFPARR